MFHCGLITHSPTVINPQIVPISGGNELFPHLVGYGDVGREQNVGGPVRGASWQPSHKVHSSLSPWQEPNHTDPLTRFGKCVIPNRRVQGPGYSPGLTYENIKPPGSHQEMKRRGSVINVLATQAREPVLGSPEPTCGHSIPMAEIKVPYRKRFTTTHASSYSP
jgi:hypothetical protein